jgi:hypothetical protein
MGWPFVRYASTASPAELRAMGTYREATRVGPMLMA